LPGSNTLAYSAKSKVSFKKKDFNIGAKNPGGEIARLSHTPRLQQNAPQRKKIGGFDNFLHWHYFKKKLPAMEQCTFKNVKIV
jgi:hypothetical protein